MKVIWGGLFTAGLLVAGCGGPENDALEVDATGVALTVDILGGTDVGGMLFEITSCPGMGTVNIVSQRDLEDLLLPDGALGAGGSVLRPESGHLFADYFELLEPGCYDVRVTPITTTGTASTHCSDVSASGLLVAQGETTEILLLSQCVAPPMFGAVDVIAAINHPPELLSVRFATSKFVCENEPFIVCVSVTDPDNDPLEFESHSDVIFDLISLDTTPSPTGDIVESCWAHPDPGVVGTHTWQVRVYDLLANGARIEAWLQNPPPGAQDPMPGAMSHAKIRGPFYVQSEESCLE